VDPNESHFNRGLSHQQSIEDLETIHIALVFILLVTLQVLQVKSPCLHFFFVKSQKMSLVTSHSTIINVLIMSPWNHWS